MQYKKRHSGSTTLGVVVGVVLGLMVALAVSLYLANSGTPVQQKTNKDAVKDAVPAQIDPSPSANKPDATKPDAGDKKLIDPNETLYTKQPKSNKPALDDKTEAEGNKTAEKVKEDSANPAKPDAKPSAKADADPIAKIAAAVTPPASPSPSPISSPSVSSPKPSPVTVAPVPTPAPAAAPAKAEPVPMPNVAPPTAGGERYFVQVGAFASVNEADAVRAKVALLGVSMVLSPRDRDGVILQRVRTLPLAAADAEKLRNNLRSNGIESSLVKVQ